MALAYTKEFLISAFLSRYANTGRDLTNLAKMSSDLYDRVGKEKFRVYASLDADAIKLYKSGLGK